MMKVSVKVKFFSLLACKVGIKEQEGKVSNELKLAIKELEETIQYPLYKSILEGKISLLINGRSVKIGSNEIISLRDNDTVAFLPIMGGG